LKIALITTLREWDPLITEKVEALGYSVEVVNVKSLDPGSVWEALRGISFDYAITPGLSPYDYSSLSGRVVKGTISPKTLPYILELVGPEVLSPRVQAEKVVGVKIMVEVSKRVYRDVVTEAKHAFNIRGLEVPLRPPPILVASDIYIHGGRGLDEVLADSAYRSSEGADILVLSSQPGLDRRVYLDALDRVLSLGKPVAADPGDLDVLADAVDMGAHIAMSLTRGGLASIPEGLRDRAAYVIIPELMSSWRTRVYELRRAYEQALSLGYRSVVVDPVVNPPVNRGLLQSIITASELSKSIKAPIMLGLNNAVEMMDVDTHASIALLTLLAAEAGVSIVMVGEESYKARGATREARRASIMASVALKLESPPKDLGITVLDLKGKSPPEGAQYKGYARLTIGELSVNCRNIAEVEGVVDEDLRKIISKVCTPWASESLDPTFS
jgi:dihydropteroate synthase-like protein